MLRTGLPILGQAEGKPNGRFPQPVVLNGLWWGVAVRIRLLYRGCL